MLTPMTSAWLATKIYCEIRTLLFQTRNLGHLHDDDVFALLPLFHSGRDHFLVLTFSIPFSKRFLFSKVASSMQD